MKRWISILLTFILVLSLAPGRIAPVFAEEPAQVLEEGSVEGSESEPEEEAVSESIDETVALASNTDADGLVIDSDGSTSAETDSASQNTEAEPYTDSLPPVGDTYARVTAGEAEILNDSGAFAKIFTGSVVMVLEASGEQTKVAFNTDNGIVVGNTAASNLEVLSRDEATSYVNDHIGDCVPYGDDNNRLLITISCTFIESSDNPEKQESEGTPAGEPASTPSGDEAHANSEDGAQDEAPENTTTPSESGATTQNGQEPAPNGEGGTAETPAGSADEGGNDAAGDNSDDTPADGSGMNDTPAADGEGADGESNQSGAILATSDNAADGNSGDNAAAEGENDSDPKSTDPENSDPENTDPENTDPENSDPGENPGDAPAEPNFDINAREMELAVGKTYALQATTAEGEAIDQSELTFASSDEAIATVNEAGVVTARSTGDADISVKYNGALLTSAVRVPVQPTKLVLNAGSGTIGLGETYTRLKVVRMEPQGSDSTITWYSSNKKYVTVNAATGAIRGVKKGSAYVYAKAKNGVWARCKVTVKKKPTKVTIAKTFAVGLSQVNRRIGGVKLSSGAASAITWSSNNKNVLDVDPVSGILYPRAVGTAKVTARTYNGKAATCTVYVREDPTVVSLRKAANLNVKGTLVLRPTLTPSNAVIQNTYASSDPSVATVDNSGKVVARKTGTAIISTTTYNGIESTVENSCVITVWNAPGKVTLNTKSITIGIGQTYQLRGTVPAGTNPDLRWSSSKKKYATVNGAGVVTGKKKGKTTITVKTSNGKKAKCTVKVVAAPKSISLNVRALTLGADGMRFKLTGKINPSSSRTSISFTSSNPDVARMDGATIVTGMPGTATITARSHNGKTATCTLTVKPMPTMVSFNDQNRTLTNFSAYTPSLTLMDATGSTDVYRGVTFSVDKSYGNPGCVSVNASTGAVTAKSVSGTARIVATASNGVSDTMDITVDVRIIEQVIAKANAQLGRKYVYGGGYKQSNPRGFDCSGLVSWAYYWGSNKNVYPGSSAYKVGTNATYANRRVTDWKKLVRGDILAFTGNNGHDYKKINHVALYLGGGRFIHASASTGKVITSSFGSRSTDYWNRNFVWGYHVY